MDYEMSELKLFEMIKRINSSNESLDTLAELVLKASFDLDDLIRHRTKK